MIFDSSIPIRASVLKHVVRDLSERPSCCKMLSAPIFNSSTEMRILPRMSGISVPTVAFWVATRTYSISSVANVVDDRRENIVRMKLYWTNIAAKSKVLLVIRVDDLNDDDTQGR